jgi:ABC-type transport system involved in cytochrome c biogenesis permease subunit
MVAENTLFLVAAGLYGSALVAALVAAADQRANYRLALGLLALALAVNTISLGLRWARIGHGPYVDLRETLASSVWGYHLALFVACLFIPRIRPVLAALLPVLMVMVLWTLVVPVYDSLLPVTYETIWLPTHVLLGKAFIGCVVVAAGLGLVVTLRRLGRARGFDLPAFEAMPSDAALDELAFRFMLAGFVFDSLMLVVGAIWAQDAWGRYWAWDPLETWSFLTWLALAFYLHLRVIRRPSPVVAATLVGVVFAFAFLTYFGVPFLSKAPHQGMI